MIRERREQRNIYTPAVYTLKGCFSGIVRRRWSAPRHCQSAPVLNVDAGVSTPLLWVEPLSVPRGQLPFRAHTLPCLVAATFVYTSRRGIP
jgi:hypothetical protein